MDAINAHRRKLDTIGAAEYLSLGKSTLEKMRLVGGGPRYASIGRRVLYDPADLDIWVEKNKRNSTSDTGRGALAAA